MASGGDLLLAAFEAAAPQFSRCPGGLADGSQPKSISKPNAQW
jgi:hypothetical protein